MAWYAGARIGVHPLSRAEALRLLDRVCDAYWCHVVTPTARPTRAAPSAFGPHFTALLKVRTYAVPSFRSGCDQCCRRLDGRCCDAAAQLAAAEHGGEWTCSYVCMICNRAALLPAPSTVPMPTPVEPCDDLYSMYTTAKAWREFWPSPAAKTASRCGAYLRH